MKVIEKPNELTIEHRKGSITYKGYYTQQHIDFYKEKLYAKYGGRPFKLNLPKLNIGTKIDRYWDDDYYRWVEGRKILGLKFVKLTIWNNPTKFRITRKEKKETPVRSFTPTWKTGEFDQMLKDIRSNG